MQFVATQLQSQQANFHGSMLLGRFLGPTYPYALLYGIAEIGHRTSSVAILEMNLLI